MWVRFNVIGVDVAEPWLEFFTHFLSTKFYKLNKKLPKLLRPTTTTTSSPPGFITDPLRPSTFSKTAHKLQGSAQNLHSIFGFEAHRVRGLAFAVSQLEGVWVVRGGQWAQGKYIRPLPVVCTVGVVVVGRQPVRGQREDSGVAVE